MSTYFMQLSTRRQCPCCNDKILVECSEEIDCNADEFDELEEKLADAIADQMEVDGWVDGYCPDCLRSRQDQIFDAERADEDRGWEDAV